MSLTGAKLALLMTPPFTPAKLFKGGKQGWWFDLENYTQYLFQDSAGTTPVTAVEQPVGKQLDKSGRGNHRIQATAASRPTLSARYNLLTKSEDFSDAAWAKILGASATANVITLTASDGSRIEQVTGVAAVEGQTHSASVTLSGTGTVGLTLNAEGGGGGETENAVVLTSTPTRYTVTHTFAAGPVGNVRMMIIHRAVYTATEVTATAAQVNPGSTATRYQRVNTSTDYDTNGFLVGKDFDGVDDNYTGTTGGGGTTGFFYCAAHRIDGGAGTVRTLFSDRGTNTGYRVCINASNKLELSAGNGVAFTTVESAATLSVGSTYVIAAWHDGVNLYVQINQGAIASTAFATATAGSASFTVGKSNTAASEFLNGLLYGDIYVQNGGVSDTNRAKTQRWLANRSGVTL